uniref:Uncharacterized protein n=1 Tax=Setaria viridis TaxID=4556 RepID=A0A4U6V375_SETVI|nr:hypothetical protein SEVIR_5G413900v2 [Setaria viridis]
MDEWDGLVPSIYRAIKERRARRYSRCSPTGSAHARFGARVEDSGWEWDQNQWDSDSKVSVATEMTHRRHGSLEELMAGEVGASPEWRRRWPGALSRRRGGRAFSCISGT